MDTKNKPATTSTTTRPVTSAAPTVSAVSALQERCPSCNRVMAIRRKNKRVVELAPCDGKFRLDQTIKFVDPLNNPRRNGTEAFKKWEQYSYATTVHQALDLGATKADLVYAIQHRHAVLGA